MARSNTEKHSIYHGICKEHPDSPEFSQISSDYCLLRTVVPESDVTRCQAPSKENKSTDK